MTKCHDELVLPHNLQLLVNATHDLKSVWINDMLDDEASGIKYDNMIVAVCLY